MAAIPGADSVSTRQQRIAELAQRAPQMGFTSLNHHLDFTWLLVAYWSTRRDGASGVDGMNAADYEADLIANLRSLLDRAKSGSYRAPPVRRVHIPKGPGSAETRPIGIPTLEDKVLQRAIVMLLQPIYEQDFKPFSYGFRPGRSAHQALEDLRQALMKNGGGWVLEVDIRRFFDTLDHAHLRELLRQRVRDGVVLRLIGKWLNAGVMEGGAVTYPSTGSPQGGVISPLLANVYLHYVLDAWWEEVVKPRLAGRAFLIRYADDFVIGFTDESDARRGMEVLPKRFGKYGLSIHPDKTRLVPFARPQEQKGRGGLQGGNYLRTFDFLGFTHYWGKSRKNNAAVKKRTAASRVRRFAKAIGEWCRRNRHRPIQEQHATPTQCTGACEPLAGRAGCSKRARPDLWEPWVGNRPGRPGKVLSQGSL